MTTSNYFADAPHFQCFSPIKATKFPSCEEKTSLGLKTSAPCFEPTVSPFKDGFGGAKNAGTDENPFMQSAKTSFFMPSVAPVIDVMGDFWLAEKKKSFVQRSMYKRELCKNWGEHGSCRFGENCQYAHGAEELSEDHYLYLQEQQKLPNDKYKSQNCRTFYREKVCHYGRRCHFRHEFRSFKKIHRHFYMCHLAALLYTHDDILTESQQPFSCGDESPCEKSLDAKRSSSDIGDSSFEIDLVLKEASIFGGFASEEDLLLDQRQIFGRPRLPVFQEMSGEANFTEKEATKDVDSCESMIDQQTDASIGATLQQDYSNQVSFSSIETSILNDF